MATSYSEKLKDPRWQRLRLLVFERDKFACTNCGDTRNELQVHHLDYEAGKEPWDYPSEFLTTYCKSCHEKEKGRFEAERMLIQSLRQNSFHVDFITWLSTFLYNKQFSKWMRKVWRKKEDGNG